MQSRHMSIWSEKCAMTEYSSSNGRRRTSSFCSWKRTFCRRKRSGIVGGGYSFRSRHNDAICLSFRRSRNQDFTPFLLLLLKFIAMLILYCPCSGPQRLTYRPIFNSYGGKGMVSRSTTYSMQEPVDSARSLSFEINLRFEFHIGKACFLPI